MTDFSAVEQIEGPADCGLLLICDHASNALPSAYGDLGLAAEVFERHIAYDIGAAALTRLLAEKFRAPALLSTFSRLLIDPNRGADDPTLVMRLSDGAVVPGNARVDRGETDRRLAHYWRPYRDAIAHQSAVMTATGNVPAIVSVHSFTPVWRGAQRPWAAAVLWDSDARIARPLIERLRQDGFCVGDNEPYDGALKGDTLYDLATAKGLPHVLIEIRQDLIADKLGQSAWADRLFAALTPVLEDKSLHKLELHPSRAKF